MESIPTNIVEPLQMLIYVSIVLILIVGTFLIKLLIDTSSLVNSMQDFMKVTQAELEPTIKEIQGTLTNLNNISSNVNNQLNMLNEGFVKGGKAVSESTDKLYKKLKIVGASAKEGLLTAVNALISKK